MAHLGRSLDDVEVPVGHRITREREESRAVLEDPAVVNREHEHSDAHDQQGNDEIHILKVLLPSLFRGAGVRNGPRSKPEKEPFVNPKGS